MFSQYGARSDDRDGDGPETRHKPPDGADDATIAALGVLSEALETTERARGHLYAFHQLTGQADLRLDEALRELRQAGHDEWADLIAGELVGRNVLPGRWSFQIIEDYDDTYYACFRDLEHRARHALVDGRRHLHEAAMKEGRRTPGHPHHRATPGRREPD